MSDKPVESRPGFAPGSLAGGDPGRVGGAMTDADALALGRRAARSPAFHWMERMLARASNAWDLDGCDGTVFGSGTVMVDRLTGTALVRADDRHITTILPGDPFVPDFRDPATLGCLVALVRDVRAAPRLCSDWHTSGTGPVWWSVWDPDADVDDVAHGATEAEAWVAALEKAP